MCREEWGICYTWRVASRELISSPRRLAKYKQPFQYLLVENTPLFHNKFPQHPDKFPQYTINLLKNFTAVWCSAWECSYEWLDADQHECRDHVVRGRLLVSAQIYHEIYFFAIDGADQESNPRHAKVLAQMGEPRAESITASDRGRERTAPRQAQFCTNKWPQTSSISWRKFPT